MPANSGPSLYCSFMSDTVGILYRSLAPTYSKVTGKTVCSTDPWTKSIIACCERQSLIAAGLCCTQATAKATSDVAAVNKLNQPCNSTSWEFWLVLAIIALIIVVVIANALGTRLGADL